jgi:hypothetical protein
MLSSVKTTVKLQLSVCDAGILEELRFLHSAARQMHFLGGHMAAISRGNVTCICRINDL